MLDIVTEFYHRRRLSSPLADDTRVTLTVEGRMLRFLPETRTTTPLFIGIPGTESLKIIYIGRYDTIPGQKRPECIGCDEQTAECVLLSNDTIRTKEIGDSES